MLRVILLTGNIFAAAFLLVLGIAECKCWSRHLLPLVCLLPPRYFRRFPLANFRVAGCLCVYRDALPVLCSCGRISFGVVVLRGASGLM